MYSLVKGVGEVGWDASRKVPTAMATAKVINKIAVRRVENRKESSFCSILQF